MLSVALQPALTTGYAIGTILRGCGTGRIFYNRKGAWQLRG